MKNNLVTEKVRQYFNDGPRKIAKVTANDDYTLTVVFDNDHPRHPGGCEQSVNESLKGCEKSSINKVCVENI